MTVIWWSTSHSLIPPYPIYNGQEQVGGMMDNRHLDFSEYRFRLGQNAAFILYSALVNVRSAVVNVYSALRNVRSPLRNINLLPVLILSEQAEQKLISRLYDNL